MKLVTVLVVLCAAVCVLGQNPPKPTIPDAFLASFRVTLRDGSGTKTGKGGWALNLALKSSNEHAVFQDGFSEQLLQRYDLGHTYRIIKEANKQDNCTAHPVSGEMPHPWAWVAHSTFGGKETRDGKSLDIWEFESGPGKLRLGVLDSDHKTPYYFSYFGNQHGRELLFDTWSTTQPDKNQFEVPTTCPKSANLPTFTRTNSTVGCISGSDIMSRAETWVAAKVPYNQGGTYGGYREDCSGYVSMAWASDKPGHTTFTMHEIAHEITKEALTPGDALLWAAEHVVIFGGWTDSGKTHYMCYEETKPGTGTIKSVSPYPYFYNQADFLPFRYNAKC